MNIYTIYKATNIINGKSYIGFTQDYKSRKRDHQKNSGKYDKGLEYKIFYSAIQKYGWDNFQWEIIYQSKELDHTKNEMENYFIEEYRSFVGFEDCKGYNMTLGGDGSHGRMCKEETKTKIRDKAIERFESEENRRKQSEATTKWWNELPEEKKKSHSEKSKGKCAVKDTKTGEIIGRVQVSHENIKNGTWISINVGYKHSEETKQKMSESQKGHSSYTRTEQIKKKQNLSRTGKGTGERNSMANEENRKKVAESKIGRKKYVNPETNVGKYCFPGTEPEGFILASLLNTP